LAVSRARAFPLLLSLHAPAPPALYTLSLHDALPIYTLSLAEHRLILLAVADANGQADVLKDMTVYAEDYADRFKVTRQAAYMARSEEHTSELQSRENLVCRLLLEKKKPRAAPPNTIP